MCARTCCLTDGHRRQEAHGQNQVAVHNQKHGAHRRHRPLRGRRPAGARHHRRLRSLQEGHHGARAAD